MLTFKDFLAEDSENMRRKVSSISKIHGARQDDAVQYLAAHCGRALKNANTSMIYRGHPIGDGVFFDFDASKNGKKKAAFYAEKKFEDIIDQFGKWRVFPQRSFSTICTTDKHYAKEYGTVVAIFPYDSTPIAVCPTEDFKDAFRAGWKKATGADVGAQALGTSISNIFTGLHEGYRQDRFIADLKKTTRSMLAKGESTAAKSLKTSFVQMNEAMRKTGARTLYEALDELLSPNYNGFKLLHGGDTAPNHREIWFDKRAVGIRCTPGATSPLPEEVVRLAQEYNIDEEVFRI